MVNSCTLGRLIVVMRLLTCSRTCVGMSIVMIGPAVNVKKFSCQAVSRGVGGMLPSGRPSLTRAMHFCVCIGARVPDVVILVGGTSRLTSATTSCHFGCSSGCPQTSVISVTFLQAGNASKGSVSFCVLA